jgi:hypothetical protein
MKEIVKTCTKHGDLTKEQVREEGKYYRCVECKLDKDRKWKSLHREQHIAASVRYKKENIEKYRDWQRKDRKDNPEKHREWQRNFREKIGPERITQDILRARDLPREVYEQMIAHYENKCAICKKGETRKSRTQGKICRLAVDHCHDTNEIRGLLCHSCNTGIGKFQDSIELLESVIRYLKTARCWREKKNDKS